MSTLFILPNVDFTCIVALLALDEKTASVAWTKFSCERMNMDQKSFIL